MAKSGTRFPGLSRLREMTPARTYRKAKLTWLDYRHNRHNTRDDKRFLVVRHHLGNPTTFDVILNWVEQHVPEIYGRLEFCGLPFAKADLSDYSLCVFWLPDPVQIWSERAYQQARQLAARCRQHGVPIVNDVEKLANASKWLGGKLIAKSGLRAPLMKRIDDVARFRKDLCGMELPLLVREDYGHCRPIFRVETMDELQQVPIEELEFPLAAEFIDVQGADTLFRKYRYFVVGSIGLPHHLQVKEHWLTKGTNQVINEDTNAEEIDYIGQPDPHHDLFLRAREALEIDMLAFDYGYTPDGEIVVWEANPYPLIHYPALPQRQYRRRAVDRTIAAIIKYYHEKAGVEYPPALDQFLQFDETARD